MYATFHLSLTTFWLKLSNNQILKETSVVKMWTLNCRLNCIIIMSMTLIFAFNDNETKTHSFNTSLNSKLIFFLYYGLAFNLIRMLNYFRWFMHIMKFQVENRNSDLFYYNYILNLLDSFCTVFVKYTLLNLIWLNSYECFHLLIMFNSWQNEEYE